MIATPCPIELAPLAWIEPSSDGTFQFSSDGRGLLAKLYQVFENDEIIDVIAWPVDATSPWWTLRGLATHLGQHEMRAAWWERRHALMVATPQHYVDHVGEAFVIIDWSADLNAILGDVPGIVCDSAALADRLRRILVSQAMPGILSRITTFEQRAAA